MKNWFMETLHHIKNMTALKSFWFNITHDPKRTLKNELAPRIWIQPDQDLYWSDIKSEVCGYFCRVVLAFIASFLLRFLGLCWCNVFLIVTFASFSIEIVRFLVGRGRRIYPLNSIFNVFFYVLGAYLLFLI